MFIYKKSFVWQVLWLKKTGRCPEMTLCKHAYNYGGAILYFVSKGLSEVEIKKNKKIDVRQTVLNHWYNIDHWSLLCNRVGNFRANFLATRDRDAVAWLLGFGIWRPFARVHPSLSTCCAISWPSARRLVFIIRQF